MKPWSSVAVPHLDLVAPAPVIYDSATRQAQPLATNREVSIYVCGITPYDATHMGHAATYVAFDTLIRLWLASGATVNYAQNVTDVDDPLIERALATGRDWREIAVEQTALFHHDMETLRVIPPRDYIGAVESIPLVVRRVQQLTTAGVTYELDGDIYYDITKARTLGQVAHLSQDQMVEIFAERGGDPQRIGKRHPLDALLWRREPENDHSWDTELGLGRPGWHIECAAIALEYLGDTIDVQGGGSDLKFPHHEMSAAHAESATGVIPFARTFLHTGMVALDGQKMSKSLGNLVFVSKLREQGVDPMAIRLAILAHQYCQDWEWFDHVLETAQERLAHWRLAFTQPAGSPDVADQILSSLANDLDTPSAIAVIDEWANMTLEGDHSSSASPQHMAMIVDGLLGVV